MFGYYKMAVHFLSSIINKLVNIRKVLSSVIVNKTSSKWHILMDCTECKNIQMLIEGNTYLGKTKIEMPQKSIP